MEPQTETHLKYIRESVDRIENALTAHLEDDRSRFDSINQQLAETQGALRGLKAAASIVAGLASIIIPFLLKSCL
jgi:hypothetical protein